MEEARKSLCLSTAPKSRPLDEFSRPRRRASRQRAGHGPVVPAGECLQRPEPVEPGVKQELLHARLVGQGGRVPGNVDQVLCEIIGPAPVEQSSGLLDHRISLENLEREVV